MGIHIYINSYEHHIFFQRDYFLLEFIRYPFLHRFIAQRAKELAEFFLDF